jgi:DNA-binding XRE family transcriptional regulator
MRMLDAQQIKAIRQKLGESQSQFAKRLGVTVVTVSRWETGDRQCSAAFANQILALDRPKEHTSMIPTVTGNAWTCVFNNDTHKDFVACGKTVAGYPMRQWGIVSQMLHGDRLLLYVAGEQKVLGVAEVVGEPHLVAAGAKTPYPDHPAQVPIKVIRDFELEKAPSIHQMIPYMPSFERFVSLAI